MQSLKVIEQTPNFYNGRTNARTGVTLNAPPPFFEWQGQKKIFYKIHAILKESRKGSAEKDRLKTKWAEKRPTQQNMSLYACAKPTSVT